MSNMVWANSLEGEFDNKFNGIIRHAYYNNDRLTYILSEDKREREFDVSFLIIDQIKTLMKESLKVGKDLIFEKCKDREIIITKDMIEYVLINNLFLYT